MTRVAALILGVWAGIAGITLAVTGHAFSGAPRGSLQPIVYLLPLASFVGAGLVFSAPIVGGSLMLGSALLCVMSNAQSVYGLNALTIGVPLMNGLAGLLAVTSRYWDGLASGVELTGVKPGVATQETSRAYDVGKWEALLKYDHEIAAVAARLEVLGRERVDEFARSYLAVNDKDHLLPIVIGIIRRAREDDERHIDLEPVEDLGRSLKCLFFANQQYVATLIDDRLAAFVGDDVRLFSSVDEYRQSTGDTSRWRQVRTAEEKRAFYRAGEASLRKLNRTVSGTRSP